MNETNLNPRQQYILNLINQKGRIGRLAIEENIEKLYPASKPTVARDLSYLLKNNLIKISGKGKNTVYDANVGNPLLKQFNLDQYFLLDTDQRKDVKKSFDFAIYPYLKNLFTEKEKQEIQEVNISFTSEAEKVAPDIFQKELERFIIEFAWKSSKIEGNTYSLLDTETLIKQKIEAQGHSKDEATMILNHKQAFDLIFKHKEEFRSISVPRITELHNCIVREMSVTTGIRSNSVGITGTTYLPLDNAWQIQEALEKLVSTLNQTMFPLEKALIAGAMISYIQPFADGNKRTSRMLANAILLANDFYPLSYRSVDETTYKKALILFYEQNSINALKNIYTDQYKFALKTYFR
ncbi:MAG TPA: Fic family protein [Patescibacteria group bacterium]|nr:Fic family protein [Patescibacteria group bacterium]